MSNTMKSKYKNNANFSAVIPTDKLFFSIGEVAEILDINTSSIRFWDAELGFKLQKNSRNERRFKHEDIENLQIVIHLKEKGFNIEGIRTELKNNKIELKQRLQSIKSLQNIRNFFIMLKNELKDDEENEDYSIEGFEKKFGERENNDLTIQSSSKNEKSQENQVDENLVDKEEMYSPEYLEEYQQDLLVENDE